MIEIPPKQYQAELLAEIDADRKKYGKKPVKKEIDAETGEV
ncbi:MAG: hypothetical protein ACRC6X_04800 [Culicoidibacterales bacterium]